VPKLKLSVAVETVPPFASYVTKNGAGVALAEEADATLAELRNLLNRMLVERLKVQETQAIQDAKVDPSALLRYRELQARRRQLEASLAVASDQVDPSLT
jgi:DNA primase